MKTFKYDRAINYSGYRENQSPLTEAYPSKDEILEDLRILENDYFYLRLYDCSPHAYRVLEVIRENNLNFNIMMGLFLRAEVNHVDHPFFWTYPDEVLQQHRLQNTTLVQEIISLTNQYEDLISAVSIGNETRSMWNNNRISEQRLVEVAKEIKAKTNTPVTFCEEYQHWVEGLEELADTVDFISLHTYPVWQGEPIENALNTAIKNYNEVQSKYPDKYCIITETGWPTKSHGSRIKIEDATITNQEQYNQEITAWGQQNDVLIYLFEAFDEPWKGRQHPDEPEKHWGIYNVHREKKVQNK
ncbi:glycosyl hydrolase family 17 protein [Candidatus Xianfuyuplasma coldseepsis]|uniref:Endo-1,3-beta-glucanase btgC n=1 Tax=Candidatus Xianfuyuplasma coldseepsis TaxID=2782163 RepID=A0A7L7KU23_9MOLU|nr:glycosyl hydrolase family 17 protein [Xianfuyuplasma coldseepsis]QMS85746.1 glycosyl hydrolase [Xianfuyuplasma coldseepsis]